MPIPNPQSQIPSPGWSTRARVTRVIDGDTLELEVTRTLQVRLLDCWAPESRTRNPQEKLRGQAAAAFVRELVRRLGPDVMLFIPAGEEDKLVEVLSLGRVLGRVWLADGRELAGVVVAAGHARAEK